MYDKTPFGTRAKLHRVAAAVGSNLLTFSQKTMNNEHRRFTSEYLEEIESYTELIKADPHFEICRFLILSVTGSASIFTGGGPLNGGAAGEESSGTTSKRERKINVGQPVRCKVKSKEPG